MWENRRMVRAIKEIMARNSTAEMTSARGYQLTMDATGDAEVAEDVAGKMMLEEIRRADRGRHF